MGTSKKFIGAMFILLSILCLASTANAATYHYDDLGRLTMVEYNNGQQIIYSYDAGGNVNTVKSLDIKPPLVAAVDPIDGAGEVAADKVITVKFSETVIQEVYFQDIVVRNAKNENPVTCTYSLEGSKLIIDPVNDLEYSVTYAVYIPAGAVKDTTGNMLANDYSFSFTTEFQPDTVAPTVYSTTPANNAADIPLNQNITINFSEDIAAGANFDAISIKAGETVVAYTYTISGSGLTLDPVSDLAYGTNYTVTVPAGAVKDVEGNALVDAYNLAFTTEAAPDTVAPEVSITSPNDRSTITEAADIAVNATDAVGVTKVEFYVGNVKVAEVTEAPYVYTWTPAWGEHVLIAKAYDAAGNVGTSSTVNVWAKADLTITSPTSGSTVSGTISTFTVNAPEAYNSWVELYIDGVHRPTSNDWTGDVTTIELLYDWDTTQYANGSSHEIEVKGWREGVGYWSSGKIDVTVNNSGSIPEPIEGYYLSNLVVENVPILNPVFQSFTLNYSATVDYDISYIRVTPITVDSMAKITINGMLMASGQLSDTINLNVGINEIVIVVSNVDGSISNTYNLVIVRSSSAYLSNLLVKSPKTVILNPSFYSTQYVYSAKVLSSVTSVLVTPTAQDPNATISVNENIVQSGQNSGLVSLNMGENNLLVSVLSNQGTSIRTYTIQIIRG